jgi:hypothetical protein
MGMLAASLLAVSVARRQLRYHDAGRRFRPVTVFAHRYLRRAQGRHAARR